MVDTSHSIVDNKNSNFLEEQLHRPADELGNGFSESSPTSMPSHLLRIQNKLKCSFCTKSIGRSLFVQCAVCDNILLCSDCFAAGVILPPHNSSHPYRVAECLESTTIFAKDWTIKEELLLLDGKS